MRTYEQEISLLGFASCTHNIATDNFGKDLFSIWTNLVFMSTF